MRTVTNKNVVKKIIALSRGNHIIVLAIFSDFL